MGEEYCELIVASSAPSEVKNLFLKLCIAVSFDFLFILKCKTAYNNNNCPVNLVRPLVK